MQDIEQLHAAACQSKEDSYIDPVTKLQVFTAYALSKNGSCCGLGCRHCPYRNTCARAADGRQRALEGRKNIIYTRGGDKGESSLFNGDRVHKSSTVFEVLGTIDELSAFVGQAYVECKIVKNGLTTKLKHIMSCLLDLGSYVATPRDSASTTAEAKLKTMFEKESVNELEKWIDAYTNKLPNLTSFILPIGGRAASSLHICRTVCRRTERCMFSLGLDQDSDNDNDLVVHQYVNRLSDFFFIAARWASAFEKNRELIYVQPATLVNGNSDDNDCRKREVQNIEVCDNSTTDTNEKLNEKVDDFFGKRTFLFLFAFIFLLISMHFLLFPGDDVVKVDVAL